MNNGRWRRARWEESSGGGAAILPPPSYFARFPHTSHRHTDQDVPLFFSKYAFTCCPLKHTSSILAFRASGPPRSQNIPTLLTKILQMYLPGTCLLSQSTGSASLQANFFKGRRKRYRVRERGILPKKPGSRELPPGGSVFRNLTFARKFRLYKNETSEFKNPGTHQPTRKLRYRVSCAARLLEKQSHPAVLQLRLRH